MPFTCDKCGWKDFRKVRGKRFCTRCDWEKNAGNENYSKEDSIFAPKETDSRLISQQDSRDVDMKDLGVGSCDRCGQRTSQTSSFEASGVEYALQQGMNLPNNKLNPTHHQFNNSVPEGAASSVSPPVNLVMSLSQDLSNSCPFLSELVKNITNSVQKSNFPKNPHEKNSTPIQIPPKTSPFSSSFSYEDSYGLGNLFPSQPSFGDKQLDALRMKETERQQLPIVAMETNSENETSTDTVNGVGENTGAPLWSSRCETNDGKIWYLFPPSDQEQSVVDMETSSE